MKPLLWIIGLLALGALGGIIQQRERSTLEAEIAALAKRIPDVGASLAGARPSADPTPPSEPPSPPPSLSPSERSELTRLRAEQAEADANPGALIYPVKPTGSVFQPARVATTDMTIRDQARNLGRATATAAYETARWASANGDYDTLTALYSFSDAARVAAREAFDRLPESERSKYGSPERMVVMLDMRGDTHVAAKVLDEFETAPGRAKLHTLWQWDDGRIRENLNQELVQGPDGWQFAPTSPAGVNDLVNRNLQDVLLPLPPSPEAQQFEATYFPTPGPATVQDLTSAAEGFAKTATAAETFLTAHNALRNQIAVLQSAAAALQADKATDPAITATLISQFAEVVARIEQTADNIAHRQTESPDSIATSKQLKELVTVLRSRFKR